MGRDSVTVDSKILIRKTRFPAVLGALEHDRDEDLDIEGNVYQCLGDYSISLANKDDSGNFEFFVDDGDTDEDYDIEVLLRLASYLEDGSYYEQSSDEGLSVFEVQSGTVTETVYDYGDGEQRGERLRQIVHTLEQREAADEAARELMEGLVELFGGRTPKSSDDQPDPWEEVRTWWKLDDPAWMKQRKSDWKVLAANLRRMEWPARQIKAMRHYFLTAEDPEDRGYFSRADRLLCAPYESPEQAKLLFDIFEKYPDEQAKLIKHHQRTVASLYDGLPYVRTKVRAFQQGVIGDVYQPLTGLKRKEEILINRSAEDTVDYWCNGAERWLRGSTSTYPAAYGYFTDVMPYVFSALEYIDRSGESVPDSLAQLNSHIALIDGVLGLTDYQQEFCDLLLAELARPDLPGSVSESLKGCTGSPFAAAEPVRVEEQLENLVASGITVNDGVQLEDLFQHLPREAMESKPYAGLLIALGLNRSDDAAPHSDSLWWCKFEENYEPGSRAAMLMRFDGMTGGALDITDAEDFRDLRREEAWVRCKAAGKPVEISISPHRDEIEFEDIAFEYDGMLKETGSGYRIYADDMRFGDRILVGAFTEEQIGELRNLSGIRMFNFDEFAAKHK
ncbi:MAG: hypothetical protein QNI99_13470 [Woeseiaceae bacterium]|nr:hypothetical protein [Woeseiaceae bacterium]